MNIVPFAPEHLRALVLQDAQAWMGPMLQHDYGESLRRGGPCFTAMDGDEIIACAGVIQIWENRELAWALISARSGPYFTRIYRAIKRFLDMHNVRRIEATVDSNFAAGHRLMKMLNFEREGTMRAYLMDGRDCDLYARVRQ